MSQSLDVIIVERIKSRLLERDGLIDTFDDYAKGHDVHEPEDFITYYTYHYGIINVKNFNNFMCNHRAVIWDSLACVDKKNEFYSNEEIDEINMVNTIKLFKAAVALVDDDDEWGLIDCVSAYTQNNWQDLANYYVNAMINKLIDDNYHTISRMIFTYIYDQQEALRAKKIEETSKHLAIQKIKRNQLFNCGLGLKLSMRDCGIELSTVFK